MPRSLPRFGASVSLLSLALLAPLAPAAERSESGSSLVVPSEHREMGTVYHVLPGKDAQVTFISDAPLEHIKGVSNQVVGYVVAGPDGSPAELQAGEFLLPIASLDTGIPLRDEHMQGERWLNAESYPDIAFSVSETTGVAVAKRGEGYTTYSVTLVGDMTIKGVTKEMKVPARLTFMDESDRTRSRAKGDLLALRCEYEVTLADFGVNGGGGMKVAEVVKLDQALFFSTVSPEDQRR